MTIAVYTKTKVDSTYLITYVRIYFVLSEDVKIRLGSFIVRNIVNDVLNAADSAIQRPLSSEELTAALALLDQKYSAHLSEVLQRLWTLSSAKPIAFIRSAPSSVAVLPPQQSPADLRPAKQKQATSDPDQSQSGNPNPDQPIGPSAL
ncbi:hypothetical protein H1R20_g11770, partial [Candolleomyces eurysporus]